MDKIYVLFPSDYFTLHQVDEGFTAEYNAAKQYFDVVLFDNINWFNDKKVELSHSISEKTQAIYRGWMMKSDEYALFYQELLNQNIELLISPDEYRTLHEFPNVYPFLEEDTAKTLTYPNGVEPDWKEIQTTFERFLIKDYVKSVKDSRFPKVVYSSISESEFQTLLFDFKTYRGDHFTGGYCFKEFLELKTYGYKTNECRIFYVKNEVLSICRNSGQSASCILPPKELVKKYAHLPSPYYTVDMVELLDGSWKIVETGDGQVSGIAESQDVEDYFKMLYLLLEK